MDRCTRFGAVLVSSALLAGAAWLGGCSGKNLQSSFVLDSGSPESHVDGGSRAPSGTDAGQQQAPPGTLGGDGGPSPSGVDASSDGAPVVVCPSGLQCDVSCPNNGTTTISGKIYDPGINNPLYNVAVYIPQMPLAPLPPGVLTGTAACSCGALFPSGAVVSTTTGVDGSFTLKNAPVGSSVPLVFQVGKWRRQVNINVTACQDNAQADKSLSLPSSITDPNDSMPQVAVSTGGLDTLECLMMRVGLPATELVAGAGGTGHVHVFVGGMGDNSPMGTGSGGAEEPPMSGAPASYSSLWDKQADLMPYDIVLLSCEGGETYNDNPTVLEQYLNAGGRVFASHYHYAWFAGSLEGDPTVPAPPADWGSNLADWGGGGNANFGESTSATIVQTLNNSNTPFPKGVALDQWLSTTGALGIEGASAGQLEVFDPMGDVGGTNKAQAWLTSMGDTLYMSFDTPVNAAAAPDGGAPAYCGRAVFSDIHVDSDTNFPQDSNPPPMGCTAHPLSPQERALEFMLFDLSSCVVSDTEPPPVSVPPPMMMPQ
jgi:hypothetical protein